MQMNCSGMCVTHFDIQDLPGGRQVRSSRGTNHLRGKESQLVPFLSLDTIDVIMDRNEKGRPQNNRGQRRVERFFVVLFHQPNLRLCDFIADRVDAFFGATIFLLLTSGEESYKSFYLSIVEVSSAVCRLHDLSFVISWSGWMTRIEKFNCGKSFSQLNV